MHSFPHCLVNLSRRLKCTFVITRCPSSVVRPSVVVNFSHLRHETTDGIQRNLVGSKVSTKFAFFGSIGKTRWPLRPLSSWDIFVFSSETVKQNSMKFDRNQDLNVFYHVCNFGLIGNTRWPSWPLIGWHIFDLQYLNVFYQVWVVWPMGKRRLGPWPLICKKCLTSPLWLLNRIQRILTGSKISTSSTKFVFLRPIGKSRWPPKSLIGLHIFDFSSETAERNSANLDRKQDLNVFYQICRGFFFCRSEKQDGRPGLWLAETFSTSPLKPLEGIQRNLTGSKI